ncbi:hypothetical protein ACQP1V_29380 [Microtetraspora malaysiensis]|uniref:hypothetical protein n=1 Tax=Microtetraspora malaysiensis TaxID=161358 RepID=UPI003D93792F
MTPVAWLVVVIAIAVMILAAGYVVMTTLNRRRLLKERFGSEHDRTVRERDGRKKAGPGGTHRVREEIERGAGALRRHARPI